LFYFFRRVRRYLVRMIMMQLGSIELLYVNAQPLHNVKTIKRTPGRRIMQSVLAFV
jgi:hypothetical protein